MTRDDIEWLDDEDVVTPHADEVLAAGRPPLRRRTRVLLVGVGAVALATAVILSVVGTGADRQQAVPTTSVSSTMPAVPLPGRAPKSALVAIRSAFPGAELTGFSAAIAEGTDRNVYLSYNVRSGRRLITISVSPPGPDEPDVVRRTASSFVIAQALGRQRVVILLRTEPGAPTARDFAALQRLVQDVRLLASR